MSTHEDRIWVGTDLHHHLVVGGPEVGVREPRREYVAVDVALAFQRFGFHVTTPERRAGIATHGLDPAKGLDTPGKVWVYADPRQALAHSGGSAPGKGGDVWEVDLLEHPWRYSGAWDGRAAWTDLLVPPHALRLHKEGGQ